MAIRYSYRINKQHFQNQDLFVGRVDLKGSFDRRMVVQRMLKMGSTITEADITKMSPEFQTPV